MGSSPTIGSMDRAQRRHNDWKKAIRKKKLSDDWMHGFTYYDNLHQYSKNKIHCSCPLCSCKTRQKNKKDYWSISDMRKMDDMNDSEQVAEDIMMDEIMYREIESYE